MNIEQEQTVCFAGHRQVYQPGLSDRVEIAVVDFVTNGKTHFLTGGMGAFDKICETAVRKVKKKFPFVRLYLVIPYLIQQINTQKDYLGDLYDEIIVLEQSAGAHRKAAISIRNQWMVDQSSDLLAYVGNSYGGAFQTLRYAKKRGNIKVTNLYKN